ncbi:MAG: SprT-like domain-containing protein [Bacteroidales bacterium]|nr:SprT-like domain-containing protein [Bacteroidales bacterium]
MDQYKQILIKYLPEKTIDIIIDWIVNKKIFLRISRSRSTKLGDFRPATKNQPCRISVNHDLNKYSFLITFVHEIAHFVVWDKYKRKAKPHGIEWKTEFYYLMNNFLNKNIFPEDIEKALKNYLRNAKATSGSDLELTRCLQKYNDNPEQLVLENIPPDSVFQIPNGRIFKKKEKVRKRYKCVCMTNKKTYLVNPLVNVVLVKE